MCPCIGAKTRAGLAWGGRVCGTRLVLYAHPREIDPDGIWTELPDGYLDKLMKSRIFRQAYEPDGMTPEEFIDFVPAARTLKQFAEGYEEFLHWVCDEE